MCIVHALNVGYYYGHKEIIAEIIEIFTNVSKASTYNYTDTTRI